MTIPGFIEKLQNLPDKHKKIILWAVVALLAAAMLFFWFNLAKKRISKLGETVQKIEAPQIKTQ